MCVDLVLDLGNAGEGEVREDGTFHQRIESSATQSCFNTADICFGGHGLPE